MARLRTVFAGILLATCALVLRASPGAEARAFLEASVAEATEVVYSAPVGELAARVRPLVERMFNLEGITRRAVGPAWRQFTPEQRQETIRLFSELVLRTYSERFEPGVRPSIEFGDAVPLERGRLEVPSTVLYRGNTYQVLYRIDQDSGQFRIYDLIVEGVSLVGNYRAQFDSILNRGTPTDLIASLRAKLDATPSR